MLNNKNIARKNLNKVIEENKYVVENEIEKGMADESQAKAVDKTTLLSYSVEDINLILQILDTLPKVDKGVQFCNCISNIYAVLTQNTINDVVK